MNFLYLEEVNSTNKYGKDNISVIPDNTVIYTFNQTAGRGRMERKWIYTGKDNIYASIILKPTNRKIKEVYSNLTQLLCLNIAETFEEYGVCPKIKWPNDIRIDGKKISGILAESVISPAGELEGLVLGFGVNLNSKKEILDKIDQAVTSLNIETGQNIDKEYFLHKVVDRFCLLYNEFVERGFSLIRGDYIKRAEFLNKQVSVKVFDKIYEGLAKDVTDNGALKIVDKNNNEKILLIGDIL